MCSPFRAFIFRGNHGEGVTSFSYFSARFPPRHHPRLSHVGPLAPNSTHAFNLSEAAQEWSYLGVVEFSTLGSDVSPEAIKDEEMQFFCYQIGDAGRQPADWKGAPLAPVCWSLLFTSRARRCWLKVRGEPRNECRSPWRTNSEKIGERIFILTQMTPVVISLPPSVTCWERVCPLSPDSRNPVALQEAVTPGQSGRWFLYLILFSYTIVSGVNGKRWTDPVVTWPSAFSQAFKASFSTLMVLMSLNPFFQMRLIRRVRSSFMIFTSNIAWKKLIRASSFHKLGNKKSFKARLYVFICWFERIHC